MIRIALALVCVTAAVWCADQYIEGRPIGYLVAAVLLSLAWIALLAGACGPPGPPNGGFAH